MKIRRLFSWLLLATIAPLLPAAGAPAANPKPLLKVDRSSVSDGKGAVVTTYADVVDPVQKAVVSVYSARIVRQRIPPFFRQFFGDQQRETREEGLGSGVIVSPNGYILTNNHVVEGADELKVLLPDDREFKARVIGADPKTDVAVIKIDATDLPTVTLADSDKLRVGDVVFAIGNPLDVGETVTMGIVSAIGRKNLGLLDDVSGYENFIQTDAAINMGNSGGALIDAKGRLVGINSAILSMTSGSIGIGFAIPINLASSIMQSLIETGTVRRGFMGVSVQELTPELAAEFNTKDAKGVLITDLSSGGPAEKAGLKQEDIIVAINGKSVGSSQDLRLLVAETAPGSKVRVNYLRDGKPGEVEVTLGSLNDTVAGANELVRGIKVQRVTDDARATYRLPDDLDGLVVTAVADDSPHRDRFHVGMVIVQINHAPVTDLATARAGLVAGRNLCLVWDRGGFRYFVFRGDR